MKKAIALLFTIFFINQLNASSYDLPVKPIFDQNQKTKGSIRDLSDYIVNVVFKKNIKACKAYLDRIETEEEIQKTIMGWAKEHVLAYQKKRVDLRDKIDLEPLNSFKMETAIRNNDWDKFLDECNLIGWTPVVFFNENGIDLTRD